MTRRSYEGVPDAPELSPQGLRGMARAIKGLLSGKSNNVADLTLTASAATTTITDKRIGPDSQISFAPATLNAAIEKSIGVLRVSSRGQYTATVTHCNNAQTDRTYTITITG